MKRLSRDAWMLIGLSLVLILLTVLAVVSQTQDFEQPPLSAESNQPDGARALRLWLEELGYQVDAEPQVGFQVPEKASVALLLHPLVVATEQELNQLEEWVRGGGVLIVAGASPATLFVAQHFGFTVGFLPGISEELVAQSPVLASPPQEDVARGEFRLGLQSEEDDYYVLLAEENSPIAVTTEIGEGLVIISTSAYPFSNAGLKETGNSQLALNLISAGGQPALIWFDEWHHGLQAGPPAVAGPVDWLRETPTGRALLYALLVIFIALALSGRSFGRPLTLPERQHRRPPIEYITALANLNRRAGHRQTALADYHYRLKRGLGYRYRLDPSLPDEMFVDRLVALDTDIDTNALRELLARLSQPQLSEAQLVQLATEASEWIKES